MHSISTPTTNELGMKLDTGMHYLGGIYRVTVLEQRACMDWKPRYWHPDRSAGVYLFGFIRLQTSDDNTGG